MLNMVLISDEEKIFEGKVSKINTNTLNGPVSILPNHQPYLSKIESSISYTKENGTTEKKDISKGFLYTNGEVCFVVIETK